MFELGKIKYFLKQNSLSKALVEQRQDLLEPLCAELLHPLERVVGQGDPQPLHAAELLVQAEVGVGEVLDVVGGGVELRPGLVAAVHREHLPLLGQGQVKKRGLLLLEELKKNI